jgi:hypothetical protein
MKMTGPALLEKAHPRIPWRRQFSYAREIGFLRSSKPPFPEKRLP